MVTVSVPSGTPGSGAVPGCGGAASSAVWEASLVLCVFFFVRNRAYLKSENRLESLVSRESSFLFNNLLFLVACFAVLWGTLFPVLS